MEHTLLNTFHETAALSPLAGFAWRGFGDIDRLATGKISKDSFEVRLKLGLVDPPHARMVKVRRRWRRAVVNVSNPVFMCHFTSPFS
jgi:hypothetical protein